MAKFFNEEDLHTVFLDAFDRGLGQGLSISSREEFHQNAEQAWSEYVQSNRTVFEKTPSIPANSPTPESVKCPECGSEMVSRNGKYGRFWGCKKYPNCKGTRDSDGRSKAEREASQTTSSEIRSYEDRRKSFEEAGPAPSGEVRFKRT
jgi:ribosomal protein L37AE/L43A